MLQRKIDHVSSAYIMVPVGPNRSRLPFNGIPVQMSYKRVGFLFVPHLTPSETLYLGYYGFIQTSDFHVLYYTWTPPPLQHKDQPHRRRDQREPYILCNRYLTPTTNILTYIQCACIHIYIPTHTYSSDNTV